MTTVQSTTTTIDFLNREPLARALANCLLFAGADSTLPVLTTVRIEFDGTDLVLASTDRYRLCVEKAAHQPAASAFATLVQRAEAKAMLTMLKAARRLDPIRFEFDDDKRVVRLRTAESTGEWRVDDSHTFPAYRSLIPALEARAPTDEISYSPAFLGDLAKVVTDAKRGHEVMRIGLYGKRKPTRVDFVNGPTVLIMPFRSDSANGDDTRSWGGV